MTGIFAAAVLWAGAAQAGAGDATAGAPARAVEQVAISGIITDASGRTFRLDYGDGEITVNMAGWRSYTELERGEQPLFDIGDNVTVTGVVDDALYRARRLEAVTVYVRDRDSFYTVNPHVGGRPWSLRPMPGSPLIGADPTTITVSGRVSEIAGDTLSLDVGDSTVSVDTAPMTYDPLDDIGAQRVRKGDWVQVSGRLGNGFFQERRLGAKRITGIYRMQVDAL